MDETSLPGVVVVEPAGRRTDGGDVSPDVSCWTCWVVVTEQKEKEKNNVRKTEPRSWTMQTYVLDLISVLHIVELRKHTVQQLQRSLHVVRGSETITVLNIDKLLIESVFAS